MEEIGPAPRLNNDRGPQRISTDSRTKYQIDPIIKIKIVETCHRGHCSLDLGMLFLAAKAAPISRNVRCPLVSQQMK